ncbi:hypothetical protein SR858_03580 [Duganella zoogloeoides]|uniref:GIY-YIG domain-containing protein n=1 Tax=Duganella zoogloeoides TaxID=75659 RepID=A0ABZ0Y1S5_9BURK|nr:hypothetical protein [Duganella zoogloeoides]WQH05432.1 hypothetical protein SR858_03580 [Duganella zoogloeoides]
MKTFEHQTRTRLGYFVYLLVDPRTGAIFYVGKGAKNRPFDHFRATKGEGSKAEMIRRIRADKLEPEVHVLRHGLSSSEIAEDVEAAVIDAIGLENLTNSCRGKGVEKGRATVTELNQRFCSRPVSINTIKEPLMKIWINQTYSPTMNAQELYDATRQYWCNVGKDKRTPDADGALMYPTVVALVGNVVVMAYRVQAWFSAGSTLSTRKWSGDPNRWEFVGNALPDHRLVGKRLVDDNGNSIRGNAQGYGYLN